MVHWRELPRPLIIAHRGLAHNAPENTLASVRAALELPVDGIEIDVYLSADGVPVVMHDPTVDRTTEGHGPVCSLTLAQLNELRAHIGWQERNLPPQPIPTLREVLQATSGRRLLCVEVKPKGIEREVLAEIRRADAVDWVWMWTFFRSIMRGFHELEPRIPAAWLCAGFVGITPEQYMEMAVDLGAAGVSVEIQDLSRNVVNAAHARGLAIYSYDKEHPEAWAQHFAWGVDAIVTDDPLPALAARDGWLGPSAPD
jgi:glycerophosphoryl diester phosphodiesterase